MIIYLFKIKKIYHLFFHNLFFLKMIKNNI